MNKLTAVTLEGHLHCWDCRTLSKDSEFARCTERPHTSTGWRCRHLPQNRDVFMSSSGSGHLYLWKYNWNRFLLVFLILRIHPGNPQNIPTLGPHLRGNISMISASAVKTDWRFMGAKNLTPGGRKSQISKLSRKYDFLAILCQKFGLKVGMFLGLPGCIRDKNLAGGTSARRHD